jgi:ribonuclease P protein component
LAGFKKPERIFLKKDISNLFEKGEKWSVFPFRVSLLFVDGLNSEFPASVLFSVSKRNFKNATDRNRLKRQMREAYRLKKEDFFKSIKCLSSESLNHTVHIGFIYTSRKKEPWLLFEKKMDLALNEIIVKLNLYLEKNHA